MLVVALAGSAATLVRAPNAFAAAGITPHDHKAQQFVNGVSVADITEHQTALQQIASLNDDTREVFSTGYQESLDYVVSTLEEAGYDPQVDQFNFPVWEESKPPVLNMVSPTAKTYVPGDASDSDLPTADFITMANSPTKELTNAPVFPVGGIIDPPTGGSASGCEAAQYNGVAGKVALVQRGTCPFVTKWSLAQAAGATGVIIYNEGNTPGRQNPIFVDNQPDPPATIAAVISSYALGNELLQAYKQGQNPTVDFKVYGTFTDRFLPQVIAETSDGDPNHVVVVGAHLDSVPEGPGINDDGSGTATLLAQAQEIADGHYKLRNKIRFAWWGAEENGLVGSTYYAHSLSQSEVDKIDVMLDYDMLSSANYVRFVYDGDGNAEAGQPGRPRGLGQGRASLRRLVQCPRARKRARAVRRPLRLRRLHRPRHPGRRRVRRRRGREDGRRGSCLRRRRGLVVRPVLPPALRQPDHRLHRCSAARRRSLRRVKVSLMLADAAQVAGGKLYVLGGGWSVLYAPAPFAIALKIEVPWSVGDDTHTLRLELLDEDGQVVLGGEDKPLILIESTFRTGIAEGIKPGTPIDAVAAFPIPPLQLRDRTLRVAADDRRAGRRGLAPRLHARRPAVATRLIRGPANRGPGSVAGPPSFSR